MRVFRLQSLAVAALLALYWVMAISAVATKSATFDEHMYIPGGYSAWVTGDFRLDRGIGVLPSRWASLALLAMPLRFPSLDQPAWRDVYVGEIGSQFLYGLGNDLNSMLLRSRMMMALMGVALGLTIFVVSTQLWGTAGGFVSLILFAFCPTMLAHGSLVTSDLTAALFFTLSVWTFWKLLHRMNMGTLVSAGLSIAALALSKMSVVMFVPMAGLLVLIRLAGSQPLEVFSHPAVRNRYRQFLLICAASIICLAMVWAAIWAAYSFRYSLADPSHPANLTSWNAPSSGPGLINSTVAAMHRYRLFPEAYLYSFDAIIRYAQVRRSFLIGEYSVVGFPQFFPMALLLKTPIALFCLLGLAGAAVARRNAEAGGNAWKSGLYRSAPLWILFIVYWLFALTSHLNIGHRHLLPIYPVLFIFAGASGYYLKQRQRIPAALVGLLLLWFIGSSLSVWPDYLTYFNELAGGPGNGYRYLVDSSLDWGQDLPGLRRWLDEHHVNQPEHCFSAYFGTAEPDYYGIRATRLDPRRPLLFPQLTGGTYCISATTLQSVSSQVFGKWSRPREAIYRQLAREMGDATGPVPNPTDEKRAALLTEFADLRLARLCSYLRQREPDDQIGHSILVYQLSEAALREAISGPPSELSPDEQVAGQ